MLILLLVSVALVWLLQRAVFEKLWERGLDVRVEFLEPYTYEGRSSVLQECVVNDKRLFLPAVEVRLSMDRNLKFCGEADENTSVSDQTYKRDIFSFLLRQRVVRNLTFTCKKRGFYRIRRAELVGYDFFFGQGLYGEREQETALYVYPGFVDTERIRLVCRAVSGMVLTQNRLFPDPFEFAGIREYCPSDPMKSINWKASARAGALLVNKQDSTTNIQASLLLDVEDSLILKDEKLTEESIRITASLAERLVRAGMELEVKSNAQPDRAMGGESWEQFALSLRAGGGQLARLKRCLACIDTGQRIPSAAELVRCEAQGRGRSKIYVMISKNQTKELREALGALAQGGSQVLWVMPRGRGGLGETERCAGVQILPWEVD